MRGGGAFTEYFVESLSLPETIKDIDDEAFKGVPSLKHVQISPKCEGFVSFDDMLFTKDYSKLLLVPEGKEGAASLPDQSTLVSATAFSRCSVLSQILVGDSATFASYDGVLYSKDLKTLVACPAGIGASIVIPAETEAIDKDALAGCKDLASITVLGSVQKIDPTAFSDETKATAVVALPAGEDYDARKATWEQAGFTNFAEPAKPGATTNPNTNEATGLSYTLLNDYTLSVSWQGKDDPEANLEIPASAELNGISYRVSIIAENAFANRGSLTSVKLPSTITTINNGAFAGCANLSTIEFPNTLRTIGERAFEATSLKDVWLPASINSIGSRAFASCSSLKRVVALGSPEVASDALAGCTNVSIYVPSGSEDTWNPGLPSDNNHLMPYGVTLSEEPLALEAGQEADLLEGGNLEIPDPVEASYSYAAAPLSVDAGRVSAKKAGATDVTAVLSLDGLELARATRTVEVSPNPEGEADIAILNSEVPLPSAYLAEARDNQINVDAPFAVTFGEHAPYDVAKSPTSIESPASFKNNSTVPVQLASVSCANRAASYSLVPNTGAVSLDQQLLFSLYPEGNIGKAVNFGYGTGKNAATPADPGAFVIPPGSSSAYTFRLNLENAKVASGIADNGITTRELVSVTCTFASYTDSFFLKDNITGKTYNLKEVKNHANDIATNGSESLYWSQYQGYLSNDSTYTCQTVWDGTPYNLCIIGINHDIKADDSKAGLTFQFKNLLNMRCKINDKVNDEDINAGGWGQSQLRADMNPSDLPNVDNVINGADNDAIWSLVPFDLQNSIEVVKKYYGPTFNSVTDVVNASHDKLFLVSYYELMGSANIEWASSAWLIHEGTQYEYWSDKITQDSNASNYLKKGYQSDPLTRVLWWERSVYPIYSTDFLIVDAKGNADINGVVSYSYGVCPCFCL